MFCFAYIMHGLTNGILFSKIWTLARCVVGSGAKLSRKKQSLLTVRR